MLAARLLLGGLLAAIELLVLLLLALVLPPVLLPVGFCSDGGGRGRKRSKRTLVRQIAHFWALKATHTRASSATLQKEEKKILMCRMRYRRTSHASFRFIGWKTARLRWSSNCKESKLHMHRDTDVESCHKGSQGPDGRGRVAVHCCCSKYQKALED